MHFTFLLEFYYYYYFLLFFFYSTPVISGLEGKRRKAAIACHGKTKTVTTVMTANSYLCHIDRRADFRPREGWGGGGWLWWMSWAWRQTEWPRWVSKTTDIGEGSWPLRWRRGGVARWCNCQSWRQGMGSGHTETASWRLITSPLLWLCTLSPRPPPGCARCWHRIPGKVVWHHCVFVPVG